jgi:serine/threonine protein kinase
LHDKSIIYRDLKPENVLVEVDGYLKLTDFGLAKKAKRKDLNQTFCGTASYLAPEILTRQGHDYTVDIWCLGTLLFEMIVGIPPFYNKN